jgi:hypothetical protein
LTRFTSRAWFQALVLGVAGVALVRCSSESEIVFDDESVSSASELGTAGFQLQVDSGLIFNQLIATLRFPDDTAQTKTIDISPDDSTITIYLGELPVGSGYEVTLAATSTTGAECTGTTKFKVKQDQTVVVNVRMECSGGIADPEVGAAQIKGEIIPATGDCPAVVERIEVAPSKAGIGVPINVEVFPTPGTAPIVSFSANGGQLSVVAAAGTGNPGGMNNAGMNNAGDMSNAGGAPGNPGGTGNAAGATATPLPAPTPAASNPRAVFRCTAAGEFDIVAEVTRAGCVHEAEARVKCFDDGTPFPNVGGGGGMGGSGAGGAAGSAGAAGSSNDGGTGGGAASNACATCTASSCPAQVTACQNAPTSAACQENRVCANVGSASSCASGSSLDCYCGTRPTATCLSFGGNGSCADVITRTSGCTDGRAAEEVPLCISERFLDVDFGLGDAYQLVACQRRNCATQCGLIP